MTGAETAPVFLCVHRGALGDFALTWPALFRLRERHPRHRFIGVGRPGHLELAKALGLLDSGLDAESADLLPFFRGDSLPPALEGLSRPQGAALLWMHPDAPLEALLRSHGIAATFHPPFPSEGGPPVHLAEHHLRALGPQVTAELPRFGFVPPAPRASGIPKTILVHPGSGSPRKNFSREFYAGLAERLPRRLKVAPGEGAYEALILLGPAEEAVSDFFRGRFRVVSPESVLALARQAASAALYIGNDSGPAHVAALLGTPTIALYRTTEPKLWGVRGPHALSVRSRSEAQALAAVESALESFPFASATLILP